MEEQQHTQGLDGVAPAHHATLESTVKQVKFPMKHIKKKINWKLRH